MDRDELIRYQEQWTQNMTRYWKERMDKLRVNRTFALRGSLEGVLHTGNPSTIEFRFLQYGIYVDSGTGKEISRGNMGDLGFRPKRKAKEWYYRKYYASRMVLNEEMAKYYGEAYNGMLTEAIDAMLGVSKNM